MTAQRAGAVLYTPEILALAVELADFPITPGSMHRGEARARLCGSNIVIGLETNPAGVVTAAGARVTACAIGQAAAALYLRAARGRSQADHAEALAELDDWLAGGGALPQWPDIRMLEHARAHTSRHGAVLLPWKAALAALSKPLPGG